MPGMWTPWRQFPDSRTGGVIEAPIGPGVYEVRKISTGEVIAFGPSPTVASDLSRIKPDTASVPLWRRLVRSDMAFHSPDDLEYRTCAATSLSDARSLARGLSIRRDSFVRRRNVASA